MCFILCLFWIKGLKNYHHFYYWVCRCAEPNVKLVSFLYKLNDNTFIPRKSRWDCWYTFQFQDEQVPLKCWNVISGNTVSTHLAVISVEESLHWLLKAAVCMSFSKCFQSYFSSMCFRLNKDARGFNCSWKPFLVDLVSISFLIYMLCIFQEWY